MKDKKTWLVEGIFSLITTEDLNLLYIGKDLKSDIYLTFMLLKKQAGW